MIASKVRNTLVTRVEVADEGEDPFVYLNNVVHCPVLNQVPLNTNIETLFDLFHGLSYYYAKNNVIYVCVWKYGTVAHTMLLSDFNRCLTSGSSTCGLVPFILKATCSLKHLSSVLLGRP